MAATARYSVNTETIMVNHTLSYLYSTTPLSTMAFSGVTTSASIYLNGPGGQAGDGFPMTRSGVLTGLRLWDGSAGRFDVDQVAFQPGDRLSVYCQNTGSDFTVKVRLNGASTSLQVTGQPFNCTLMAVVEFILTRT